MQRQSERGRLAVPVGDALVGVGRLQQRRFREGPPGQLQPDRQAAVSKPQFRLMVGRPR